MTLQDQARAFFAQHPELTFAAIGTRDNLRAIDPAPFGIAARQIAIEDRPDLAELYLRTNQAAFGKLGLPRWVLSDLYLMPTVIGAFLCEARHVRPDLREALHADPHTEVIGAAYVGAPTVHAGLFIGVSLLSFLEQRHGAAWVKSLSLKMLKAQRVRGVAQWDSVSLRVHTRLGAMKLIGRAPGGHEYAERTFVYETDLSDEAKWANAMERKNPAPATQRIPKDDLASVNALLTQHAEIVAPGLEDGRICVRTP